MTKRFLQTQQSELYQNAWPARAFGAINQYVKRRYVKSEVPAWETPEATERQKASSPESRELTNELVHGFGILGMYTTNIHTHYLGIIA